MYNATRPPGGRPLGEHKIQLMVPGKGRGVYYGTLAELDQRRLEQDRALDWLCTRTRTSSFCGMLGLYIGLRLVDENVLGESRDTHRSIRWETLPRKSVNFSPATATGDASKRCWRSKSRRLSEALIKRMELTSMSACSGTKPWQARSPICIAEAGLPQA